MPAAARILLLLGAVAAMLAVILGAFGAHGLRARLPADALSVYHTGVQYHFWHALGVLAIGLTLLHLPASSAIRAAGWLMLAGIVIFSGSLYLLATTGTRWLGAITPLGGLAFIAAWAAYAWGLWRAGA
ncbi:MAG: DUF423 domain-containing protein [Burkholderiales bacterium]|nr:DUF423 domain-containing protein [Burkholderiales bacterium]